MMMEKKKAQSTAEFLILIGGVVFFFLVFLLAVQVNITDKTRENKNLVLQDIARSVQDEINLATDSSDGYYRNFTVPDKLINSDYQINVQEDFVYVRTTDNKYAIALPVANVTGDVQKGSNIIRKKNGKVFLNQ